MTTTIKSTQYHTTVGSMIVMLFGVAFVGSRLTSLQISDGSSMALACVS
jgi:hypothetical protein